MGYSAAAVSMRAPKVVALPRSGDRLSWLYLDAVRVWQDDTGVAAQGEDFARLDIPVAGLSLLLLGPGVSVTTPALASLHRAGTVVVVTSSRGTVGICSARPLTGRAKWAEAQARVWADPQLRLSVARSWLLARFPAAGFPAEAPLSAWRGLEGAEVKRAYRLGAAQAGLRGWRRDTSGGDPVNSSLNVGNAILYGAAAASCSALGLSPALGFIHQGSASALLFDVADVWKVRSSIRFAFEFADDRDPVAATRRAMREFLHRNDVMAVNLKMLTDALAPYTGPVGDDALLDDDGVVEGHRNWDGPE